MPLSMISTWLDFRLFCWKLFGEFSFQTSRCICSRSNTLSATSWDWLVRLTWNKQEGHLLDTGLVMWPWTLTAASIWPWIVQGQISTSANPMAVPHLSLVWLMWNKREKINWILHRLCDLALWLHSWPWIHGDTLRYEQNIHFSANILKWFIRKIMYIHSNATHNYSPCGPADSKTVLVQEITVMQICSSEFIRNSLWNFVYQKELSRSNSRWKIYCLRIHF